MASRYNLDTGVVPKVGDVVNYKGNPMVIIKIDVLPLYGEYIAYLLDEETFIKSIGINFIKKNLLSICLKKYYSLFEPIIIPFRKIKSLSLEVQEVSHTMFNLKEK